VVADDDLPVSIPIGFVSFIEGLLGKIIDLSFITDLLGVLDRLTDMPFCVTDSHHIF